MTCVAMGNWLWRVLYFMHCPSSVNKFCLYNIVYFSWLFLKGATAIQLITSSFTKLFSENLQTTEKCSSSSNSSSSPVLGIPNGFVL